MKKRFILIVALMMLITAITAGAAAITAVITLNKAGGAGGRNSVTATYNKAMPTVTTPTKKGYTFSGYYTKTGGKGTQYYKASGKSAKNSTFKKNSTLYAYWVANKYNVTFDQQSPTTQGTTNITVTFNKAMPAITPPRKTGYTFNGYYTKTGGAGVQYYKKTGESARKWDIAKNTKLYAYWTANKYTVTLNNQGATTAGTSSVTGTYNVTLPNITVPKKTGHNFKGYFTGLNGTGNKYYDAAGTALKKWDIPSNQTLYASWEKKTFTISLNFQGGIEGSTQTYVKYGESMPKIKMPRWTNYAFKGYFEKPNGEGRKYYDSDGSSMTVYNEDANRTLYAYWVSSGCDDVHDYALEVTRKATFTTNGEGFDTCIRCRDQKPVTIPRVRTPKLRVRKLTYTGRRRKPGVIVTDINGKKLPRSAYKVRYKRNRNVSRNAKAIVTLKGKYSGTKTLKFTIIPKGTRITYLKGEPGAFIVKWKKQPKKTNGYELRYSLNRKFKRYKKVVLGDSRSYVGFRLPNLKHGRTYYLRIRTYKTVKGRDIYSKWSKTKPVRVR